MYSVETVKVTRGNCGASQRRSHWPETVICTVRMVAYSVKTVSSTPEGLDICLSFVGRGHHNARDLQL